MKITSKNGFTLAEVLITLGIIGIVAAMTIPNLIANNKARVFRSKYLKAYSAIAQMVKLIEADDVDFNEMTTVLNLAKYLPGSTRKTWNDGLQSANLSKNDPFYYRGNEPYKTYDGKGEAWKEGFDDIQYALLDGSLLLIEWPNHWISVDINGYNNGPNRWGVDLFTFEIVDGKLYAMGEKGTMYTDTKTYCNPDKQTHKLNGIACAHLAGTDTEYFKKAVRLK